MGSRRRYLRPLTLFILMAFFSLSLMGRLDSRLHIGGFDWDFDFDIPGQTQMITDSESEGFLMDLDNDLVVQPDVSFSRQELPVIEIIPKNSVEEQKADNINDADEELKLELNNVRVDVDSIPQVENPNPEEEREKPVVLVHTVRSGETLWDIAKSYGITIDNILASNDIPNSNRIRVGQQLQILTVKGVLHQVSHGESVWEIAQRYGVSLAEITEVNSIDDASKIQPGAKLVIPGATHLLIKDALVVNGQLQQAFDWPARARISSRFGIRWGKMHNGIDIAVVTGTPIKAAADGKVIYSGTNGGYGIMVIVDHGKGVETRYAHHSRNAVKVGQTVKRGDVIAYSGNTGVSTGPHLHFEIRYNGSAVDPLKYLRN